MTFFKKYKIPFTIFILIILLSITSIHNKDHQMVKCIRENFADLNESRQNLIICNPKYLYLKNPTKCFDCEKDLINRKGIEYAWAGQPSKCFDCEKQLEKTKGTVYGSIGNPSKCLSCDLGYLPQKNIKKCSCDNKKKLCDYKSKSCHNKK